MSIDIIDKINSLLQCIMFILSINYCLSSKVKKTKKKLLLFIVILWIAVTVSYKVIGNSSLNVIITHIISLSVPYLLFKEDILGVVITHTIIYSCIAINLLVANSILHDVILKHSSEHLYIGTVIVIYLPQILMSIAILRNLDKIFNIYRWIRSRSFNVMSLLIVSIITDFTVSLDLIRNGKDNPIFASCIFFLLAAFLISISIYFSINEIRAKEIYKLNEKLSENLLELKKVKHDYGSQISYLYALCLMERYDQLSTMLKNIIDGHASIEDEIKITENRSSIIMNILSSIDINNVNVVIDENVKFEELAFDEVELHKILSNIVRNAITAMKGIGILTIRTSYKLNDAVITVQNNGPKISKNIIERIFETGFTTKENGNESHGYGLAIVKEIVEKKSGKIKVVSTNEKTEFRITVPLVEN